MKERTRCLIYTRVMGYLSPTYRYNVGKRSEFYSRKYFDKDKASIKSFERILANKDFVEKYA